MEPIPVKILGNKRHQRYVVWRAVQAAWMTLEKEFPDLTLDIQKVSSVEEIQQYTPVFAFPSLVIAGKLVCVGRYPARNEVLEWLKTAIHEEKILSG
jgi:hypothetical protein